MKKKNQKQEEEQFARKAKLVFLLFLSFFLSSASQAEPYFKLNQTLLSAQKLTYQLRLDEARSILIAERKQHPENYAAVYLNELSNALELFITEDETKYSSYISSIDKGIDLLEDLPRGEQYRNYAIADLKFYMASIKGKFDDFYSAALDLNSAYKLLKDNDASFPKFLPNKKVLGLIQSFLSTVPEQYMWAVKLMGLEGDLDQGLSMMEEFVFAKNLPGDQIHMQQEAGYFYAYTLLQIAKEKEKAWAAIEMFSADYRENLLSVFFRATIAEKLQKNEEVIEVLDNRPKDEAFMPFHYLNFLLGEAKLNRLDKDADLALLQFYKNYKGKNYVKTCLQKLSWHYLIQGNTIEYQKYKDLINSKGNTVNEDDKLAQLYYSKPKPNIKLLKTRLLFDGGYMDKAFDIIHPLKSKELNTEEEKAEYAYRKARVYEAKGYLEFALTFYEFATVYGENSAEYYGAYACLILGDYALDRKDKPAARNWYSKAMTYHENREYRGSIEQRAKQGIKNAS